MNVRPEDRGKSWGREEGRKEGGKNLLQVQEIQGGYGGVVGGSHGYLGCVFLHCLEVEEGDVDQVIAMDDSHQLPFDVVALAATQHVPQLWVLTHTHTQTHTFTTLYYYYYSLQDIKSEKKTTSFPLLANVSIS